MTDLQTALAARETAEARVATVRAQIEATAMERSLKLIEAPQPVRVPWQEYPAYDEFNRWGSHFAYEWTSPEDRSEGRYRPLYENAQDVRRMRAETRKLVELFPVARGALQKLSDYIMGTGWEFVVKPTNRYKQDPNAKQLAAVVQGCVDSFLEYNNFTGRMDREIHEESRIDGDCFAVLYPEGDQVRVELTDPGCILEPADKGPLERYLRTSHKLNGWWHGVHTVFNPMLKRDDVARPLGYHAVYDNSGQMYDYLPSWRVEHVKRNVGSSARVGVTDFLTVIDDLENEGKIRKNTAVGAAILAAIVMIRQHAPGVSRSSIEGMVTENATATYERPVQGGSRSTNVEGARPGTIKDTPAGMQTTLGALGQLRSPVYIEVAKYLQSVIGQPWSMPYYMISGDGSEGNYASTLVSESPFIKYCEHEQAFYAGHFKRLVWKALRLYADCGALRGYPFQHLQTMLEIEGEYASPASRDKMQQAQVNQIYVDMGVMSKRTVAADAGLDLDEEIANGATVKAPEPSPFGSPFGGGPMGRSPRLEALAAKAIGALRESRVAEAEERWVTLDNGVHIKIDDDGSISDEISKLNASGSSKAAASKGSDGPPKKSDGAREQGAKAVYQGKKFRTISKRAKINVDQMNDLMKERGYEVGWPPETDLKTGVTKYPVAKGGQTHMVDADDIQKFLTTEDATIKVRK